MAICTSKGWLTRTIYFGYVSLGRPTSVRIGITYSTRESITRVVFHDVFGRPHESDEVFLRRLEQCVRKAELASPSDYRFSATLSSPLDFSFYSRLTSEQLDIGTTPDGLNLIILRSTGCDDIDALHEAAQLSVNILDILSVFTNSAFFMVA